MSRFTWGSVTAVGPLRVQLDGDAAALPFTPDTLIDPLTLIAGDRVRCELAGRRLIVHGVGGGIGTATAAVSGVVELATSAEARAGVDASRAVTPAGLRAASIPVQGQTPSSVVVGSGSASVAADGTVTFTGASSVSLQGVFDGLGSDAYEIHGVAVGAADLGGALWLRHRNGTVDQTVGHYTMVGYGVASSWGTPSFGGASASNGPAYIVGYRQYSNFDVVLKRPAQAQPKELIGLAGSDGTAQVAGWTFGRTSFATIQDSIKLLALNGTPLTGWIKVVKIA